MADQIATDDQTTVSVPSKKRKRNGTTASGLRKPKEKPIQCPVCLEPRVPSLILDPLSCSCKYCVYCIRELFTISLQSENGISNYPAMCCGNVLDHVLLQGSLAPQLRRAYKSKVEEMASNDPLYCGNTECGAFILENNIKDDFGSCGKCKMKTCVKKECNKTKSEHLGIHTICPGELDTEELRTLAEEQGWKRCPKCYALTERNRGCNDIRCVCRTEWCYKCGKGLKGTKDACLCYLPRPRVAPPVQPPQNNVQFQRETIVIHDGDDQDTSMVDVKPSIEEIQRNSRTIFYTESDLMEELARQADLADQADGYNLIAHPETSSSQNESDVMQELDALAAPNARDSRGSPQRTREIPVTNTERQTFTIAGTPVVDDPLESLEDMLHTFNSYEALSSGSTAAIPNTDQEHLEIDFSNDLDEFDGSAEPVPNSFIDLTFKFARHETIAADRAPEPPRYAHTPPFEPNLHAGTFHPSDHEGTCTTITRDASVAPVKEPGSNLTDLVTPPKVESELVPEPAVSPSPNSSPCHPEELPNLPGETVQAVEDTSVDFDAEWLMGSIEEYLDVHSSSYINEAGDREQITAQSQVGRRE